MNNKNEKRIKCIFYMKGGIQIERRITSDAFNNFINLFTKDKEGFLWIADEMEESITIIKINEIQALKYWN